MKAPLIGAWVACAVVASTGAASLDARHFDLLIRGARVVDGTGAPAHVADVGVNGDTIVAVGRLTDSSATRVVDAKGRVLTPGFIDLHAHLDDATRGERGLRAADPRLRAAQNYVTQGVTTAVVNPDGGQPKSLVEQRAAHRRLGIGVNAVLMNGHNSLRAAVMGTELKRPANAAEIARMQAVLRRGLEDEGSFGLSLGLEYFSGQHSTTDELVELARVLTPYNGVFIAHPRSQGAAPMWYTPSQFPGIKPPTLDDSLEEVFRVATETGCIAVVSHVKGWGPGYRGAAARTIAKIQAARDRGAKVFADTYPYDSAGSDGNFVALPMWALRPADAPIASRESPADYRAALQQTLASPEKRALIERDVAHQVALKGGAENVRVLEFPDVRLVGRSLAEIMVERGVSLSDCVIALQLEGDPAKSGGAKLRAFSMDERDVELFIRQPWCAGSTDGWIVLPETAVGPLKYLNTNRRCFGSYPRRLAHYVRDRAIDTLEEQVRKCSGLPAEILNLRDRGRIAAGLKADLALIDLAQLTDHTTFLEPNEYATGVDFVWVNGVAVVDAGRRTLALPGQVLEPAGRTIKAGQ